jgi:hypothetical protein
MNLDKEIQSEIEWRTLYVQMEQAFGWRKWTEEIPFIEFPRGWRIKVVPPFGGAMVRFYVDDGLGDRISVYLDCHNMLGASGGPYWEVYPIQDDTRRFPMHEVGLMLAAITREIKRRKRGKNGLV